MGAIRREIKHPWFVDHFDFQRARNWHNDHLDLRKKTLAISPNLLVLLQVFKAPFLVGAGICKAVAVAVEKYA